MPRQTFKKGERLHSKKLIKYLFANGNTFFVYPFKVFFVKWPEKREFPVEVLVSVSKRKIKKAVKRNSIKRLIRESYRKNKEIVWEFPGNDDNTLLISFIYIADDVMEYKEIEKKIILILQRIKKHYEKADR